MLEQRKKENKKSNCYVELLDTNVYLSFKGAQSNFKHSRKKKM